ncbi:hypothetical protein GCM10027168_69570 [Streptomyces capparidis]
MARPRRFPARSRPQHGGDARGSSQAASRRRQAAALHRAAERYQPHSLTALRVSVGLVFLCFGALKLFPSASPAEQIATRATSKLTLGLLPSEVLLPLLGAAEVCLGLALLTGILLRHALAVLYLHMAGVLSSIVLLPEDMWHNGVPTLEGQYVLKNAVLITACLAVTADELTR